jgi:cytochrome P450
MALPPGPRGGFFLGSFREIIGDRLGTMTRYQRQHGDVVAVRMGPLHVVAVHHPDLIEQVLVKLSGHLHKGTVEQLIRPAAGNGIFLSEDDFWKRQRRMVSPPFHKTRIASYGKTMVEITERVIETWRDGEERDVYKDMSRIGMSVAAKVMFDVDVEAKEGEELGAALAEMMGAVSVRMNSGLPLPDFVPTPNMLRLRRAVRRLDGILYDAIAHRRREAGDRDDLLSLLLAVKDEDDGRGMTDRQLRDEAMNLFVAGFETTAISLAWTLYLLAKHPELAEAARRELRTALAAATPTAADLPRLGCVERLVNEALRLYPPAWAFDRLAREDLELGGYTIPKGWNVWILPWVVHRDPRFWSEPERFDPARWTTDAVKGRHKYSFIPFGGGPRVCIGNAFAMMETQLVLATILSRFQVEHLGEDPTPEPGFTLRPSPAVRQRVRRAASA